MCVSAATLILNCKSALLLIFLFCSHLSKKKKKTVSCCDRNTHPQVNLGESKETQQGSASIFDVVKPQGSVASCSDAPRRKGSVSSVFLEAGPKGSTASILEEAGLGRCKHWATVALRGHQSDFTWYWLGYAARCAVLSHLPTDSPLLQRVERGAGALVFLLCGEDVCALAGLCAQDEKSWYTRRLKQDEFH